MEKKIKWFQKLDKLVVLQKENNASDKFSINIHDLNSGIYFLRLHVNNSVVVKKFVKE